MDISKFSKEELERELKKREDEENRKIISEREVRFAKLLKYRDILLEFIPHSRTSCSDDNITNGLYSADYGPRCVRCGLLEFDEYSYERHDFDLGLNIIEVPLDNR